MPRVALVGRPNAGKSTLFNKLIGEDRSIVHDQPGTTRDSIDTVIETPEGPLCFVDTAGMRRPSKTDFGTEHYSVLRALDALEGADLAMLVIDGTVGATHQDQRLAERIGVSGSPAVVIVNKWDLVDEDQREDVLAGVGDRLAFLGAAPVLRVSARSGRGVHRILPALFTSVEAYHQRIATGALNRALGDLQTSSPAPGGPASATASRGPSTRRPSPCSPRRASAPSTCATWSGRCASASRSARPPSSCGCASAEGARRPGGLV